MGTTKKPPRLKTGRFTADISVISEKLWVVSICLNAWTNTIKSINKYMYYPCCSKTALLTDNKNLCYFEWQPYNVKSRKLDSGSYTVEDDDTSNFMYPQLITLLLQTGKEIYYLSSKSYFSGIPPVLLETSKLQFYCTVPLLMFGLLPNTNSSSDYKNKSLN